MSSTDKQTWYEVKPYLYRDESWIVPITVVRETERTITVEEERTFPNKHFTERRRNKDNSLWHTRGEAEAEVTRRLTEKVRQAEEKLESAKTAFEKWFMRA